MKIHFDHFLNDVVEQLEQKNDCICYFSHQGTAQTPSPIYFVNEPFNIHILDFGPCLLGTRMKILQR